MRTGASKPNPRALRHLRIHPVDFIEEAGDFVKSCYMEGLPAILAGKYNRRQAAVIIAACTPAILALLVVTVPALLFPTPGHQAYYYFANVLQADSASLIPFVLGAISSTLGLKVPLT